MVLAGVALVLFLVFAIIAYINIWFCAAVFIWTIASMTWFFANIGDKYRTGQWYDWIFGTPTFVLVCIFAFFDRLINKK